MVLRKLDDRELVLLYSSGDEKAFEVLLLRHKAKMYRYILLKVKDQLLAEDIFQETFIKVINTIKLGNYNEEGKFLPWAMRIAHNLVVDHFRKANKVRMISESSSLREDYNIFHSIGNDELTVEESMGLEELKGQMVELLEHLPDVQREIVMQRLYQDLSFKEIAEMENISINTALGRMRYALINIRKLIDKHQMVTEY